MKDPELYWENKFKKLKNMIGHQKIMEKNITITDLKYVFNLIESLGYSRLGAINYIKNKKSLARRERKHISLDSLSRANEILSSLNEKEISSLFKNQNLNKSLKSVVLEAIKMGIDDPDPKKLNGYAKYVVNHVEKKSKLLLKNL